MDLVLNWPLDIEIDFWVLCLLCTVDDRGTAVVIYAFLRERMVTAPRRHSGPSTISKLQRSYVATDTTAVTFL